MNENLRVVHLTAQDWDYITSQLIPMEDDSQEEAERKYNLSEQIQYQIGNRSPGSGKVTDEEKVRLGYK